MTVQFFVNHVLALARRRVEWVEHLEEFAETLCTTAAGGRGQADGTSAAVPRRGQHLDELSVFAQTPTANSSRSPRLATAPHLTSVGARRGAGGVEFRARRGQVGWSFPVD
jgi:hypothetical protein